MSIAGSNFVCHSHHLWDPFPAEDFRGQVAPAALDVPPAPGLRKAKRERHGDDNLSSGLEKERAGHPEIPYEMGSYKELLGVSQPSDSLPLQKTA